MAIPSFTAEAEQAAISGTDAAIVYGTAVVIADIEDDFVGADARVAHMQEQEASS